MPTNIPSSPLNRKTYNSFKQSTDVPINVQRYFISYLRTDQELVSLLASALNAQAAGVWFDAQPRLEGIGRMGLRRDPRRAHYPPSPGGFFK
jgi:hypothetical protein